METYYAEEILIQRLQRGEISHVEFILQHSREWSEEFKGFCRKRSLPLEESSALAFIAEKDREFETAIEEGNV